MLITHRAGVLGKPVAHSLSPVLHNAGFAAAGLTDWTYQAFEVDEPELAAFAGRHLDYAGFSLTMPLKEVALTVASSASEMAVAVGAANTLVRKADGWHADNTDIPGMVMALQDKGVTKPASMAVLGAGGTARAALGTAATLGTRRVVLFARRPEAASAELDPVAEALGLSLTIQAWPGAARCGQHDVVISTVPKGIADDLSVAWRPGTVVFDVVYDPWPTTFAASAVRAGCQVVSGLDLLHAQALGQFFQFTGVPAPAAPMRAALDEAVRLRASR